ncbi:MAG: tRNA (adenosine(37)-N6)-dimethylallyltransferase MiaA [Acidobacteriota bacterium]|nr:tRNA (adenosine(37)-N6)-dimethylallyltransferase MiaA [Acidobacteriota bacterium]
MPLVAVVGPTGSGKSELGLRIAEYYDGEIVNCDSMQIYSGFDIGTAKVPLEERRGIPHHLIDCAAPDQVFSAGDYARAAALAICEISGRGKLPVLVGGTGFYLRALLEGLPDLPPRSEPLRRALARRGPDRLLRMLQRLDAGAARRIHANDIGRVTRALEIRLLTGKPAPARASGSGLPGFRVRKIGLFPPREELYAALDRRTKRMFGEGLLEEVQGILARGVPPHAKPFEAVGYRQALAVVLGRITVADAVAQAQQATRNYAKRQITWFRHDPTLRKLEEFGSEAPAALAMEECASETNSPF